MLYQEAIVASSFGSCGTEHETVKVITVFDDMFAIVRADKTLYRVKKGNYMGQNFGLITDVTESEIKLKEIVQDSAGDWAERQSVLPLLEEVGKGDKK